jgi:anaerobic selenocysteine-containing dehydrogenase
LKATVGGGVGLALEGLIDVRAVEAASRELKLSNVSEFTTSCNFCSCGCGMIAAVRDGTLITLEGDYDHVVNRGSLCVKGMSMFSTHTSPQRLQVPRYRAPGSDRWVDITWEDAVERIAQKIKVTRTRRGSRRKESATRRFRSIALTPSRSWGAHRTPTRVLPVPEGGAPPRHRLRPVENVLHPNVKHNPTLKYPRVPDRRPIGKVQQFPYVLMTSTVAEHWCAGSTTRNIPWLNELVPEPMLEMRDALARKLAVNNGDVVKVSSARGEVVVKAVVSGG